MEPRAGTAAHDPEAKKTKFSDYRGYQPRRGDSLKQVNRPQGQLDLEPQQDEAPTPQQLQAREALSKQNISPSDYDRVKQQAGQIVLGLQQSKARNRFLTAAEQTRLRQYTNLINLIKQAR
jgi:hypothetical protein